MEGEQDQRHDGYGGADRADASGGSEEAEQRGDGSGSERRRTDLESDRMRCQVMTDPIREMVVNRVNAAVIRHEAMKGGMKSLRQDGWRKVLMGQTTVDEVARVTAGDVVF